MEILSDTVFGGNLQVEGRVTLYNDLVICGGSCIRVGGDSFSSFADLKTKLNILESYSRIRHYTATCPDNLTDSCLKFEILTTQFEPTTQSFDICGVVENKTFCNFINADGSAVPYYTRVLGVYATTTNGCGNSTIASDTSPAQSLFVDVGLKGDSVIVSRASGTDLSSAIFHVVYDHVK